jgi:hypothetical protein
LSCADEEGEVTSDTIRADTLKVVEDAPWRPTVLEVFTTPKHISCVAIEPTTFTLRMMRSVSPGDWPLEYVASVGIQLVDILIDMRFKRNVSGMTTPALKLPERDQIIMIDPIMIHPGLNEKNLDLSRFARLTSYLHHGPSFPESDNHELSAAIKYADLRENLPPIGDYNVVRGFYEKILADKHLVYEGKLLGLAQVAKNRLPKLEVAIAALDVTTTTKAAASLAVWLPIMGIVGFYLL